MSGRLVSFPVPYGKGLQRVSLYAPTTALPYYRITYRTGGKRFQLWGVRQVTLVSAKTN